MNFAHHCLFLSSVKKGMGLNKSVFCHFHMVAEVCDLPLLLGCCWLVYCLVMVSLRADLTQSISLFRRSTTGWSVASVASFPSCYLVPRDCRACAVLLAHPANASCSGSKTSHVITILFGFILALIPLGPVALHTGVKGGKSSYILFQFRWKVYGTSTGLVFFGEAELLLF